MQRRTVLVCAGTVLPTALGGCLGDGIGTDEPDDRESVEDRVIDCEKRYISETVVTGDDTTIDGSLDPQVTDFESRPEGEQVVVETVFGATRSVEGEPDERIDYQVVASYLVAEDVVYRIEGADGDPRDGTTVECPEAGAD